MARLDWFQREQLILEAIRDLEDEHPMQLQNQHIEAATGLSADDVGLGLAALLEGDYVLGNDYGGLRGVGADLFGARLAPRGRVHVKQWPAEDAQQALLDAVDDALAQTDDPEEQAAGEKVKAGLRGLGTKVLNELALSYARRYAPGLEG